jgi:acyl-CoA thioester hydrolase
MHEVRLRIRWRDIDSYGHVNNAVYLNYLEECRDRLVEDLFGSHEAWDFVLAHVGIDFRSELRQADGEVVVRCEVAGFGRSSIRTRERVEKADGTLAAEA